MSCFSLLPGVLHRLLGFPPQHMSEHSALCRSLKHDLFLFDHALHMALPTDPGTMLEVMEDADLACGKHGW